MYFDNEKNDSQVMILSLWCTALCICAFGIDQFLEQRPTLVIFPLLYFALRFMSLGDGLSDPRVLMILFSVIYVALPSIFGQSYSPGSIYFPLESGLIIHSLSSISIVAAIGLSNFLMPRKSFRMNNHTSSKCLKAGLFGVAASIILSIIYILQYGIIFDGTDYANGFMVRQTSGSGILLLAVPLAAAGLAFLLVESRAFNLKFILLGFVPYILLYLAHGQRKYIIIPVVLILARYFRTRSFFQVINIFLLILMGGLVFMYFGYLRMSNFSILQVFDPILIENFFNNSSDYIGGETVPVVATASAAYEGFVDPLPYAGDYLQAWRQSLPQFFFGSNFENLNYRFASQYAPIRAADGMGWGFSFFGEAYLVGGYTLVVLISFITVLFFRKIVVWSGGVQSQNWRSALLLTLIPFAFWYQRNSFAQMFRELISIQFAIVILLALISGQFFATGVSRKRNTDI